MNTVHSIKLGTLVEVNLPETTQHGIRGFVVDHTRDCDGEAMYAISLMTFEQAMNLKEISKALYMMAISDHWPEDCLIVIRELAKENGCSSN